MTGWGGQKTASASVAVKMTAAQIELDRISFVRILKVVTVAEKDLL